jgi:Ca-activated chloride channel family protein
MNILYPSALLLGLLALPILLLYMLKLRRREVEVSSTLLWQMLLRDRQANTPWQRLRRNILLFLQLLILTALVLALTRPAIPIASVASGSVIVLLDASASMNATDVSPSRFEAARSTTRTLINGLGSSDVLTLIAVESQPIILASNEHDKSRLRAALDAASPSTGSANWKAAFALAIGAASQSPNGASSSTTVILSDGGLPLDGLPSLPGKVRYIPFGQSGNNLAISALALRSPGNYPELFTSVTNYGAVDRVAILSLYINDELFSAQQISLPASEQTSVSLSGLPDAPTIYQARLTDPDQPEKPPDSLSLDDTAYAVYQPHNTGSVLVVSTGNIFLEQVLAAMPGITPYRALPDENGDFQLPEANFDLYVFDGYFPTTEDLPPGNLLLINPPDNSLFPVTGNFTVTENIRVFEQPITQYVDFSDVHVSQARQITAPPWANILIQTGEHPLILAGEMGGRRLAAIAFDLHNSDLPLQIAFPILFANLIQYLVPSQPFEAPQGLQPGENLYILPQPEVNRVVIASPSNQLYTYTPSEKGILFTKTGELGVYAVNYLTSESQSADFFAVNLFDPQESNIQPAASIRVGSTYVQASAQDQVSLRELWPTLTVIALLIVTIEWWIYHRASQVSHSPTSDPQTGH